jgi:hypothetical protein
MKRAFVMMFAFALVFTSLVCAQQTFTNNDVLAMWKQGLSEAFILNAVQKSGGAYSLGPEDVRALIAAKIPNSVIEAMSAKAGAGPAAVPASAPSPVPNAAAGNTAWPTATSEPSINYRPDGGALWTPLATEAVTWSREGVSHIVKKVATAGIGGRAYTGTLNGPSSVSVLSNPPEFVIEVTAGGNPNTWALVRLQKSKKNRTVSDPAHQALMIHMMERRGNQYRMRSDNDLSPGEYALVNLNSANDEAPAGMLYTFRVR